MNTTIKAKWLAALRSGKYQQGTGVLKNGDHFCCLGVLCSIAGVERDEENGWFIWRKEKGHATLPYGFGRSVGVSDDAESTLAVMNDDGKSFAQIADYIEKHY